MDDIILVLNKFSWFLCKMQQYKNSYLSHRIIHSFPLILKWKIYEIKTSFIRPEFRPLIAGVSGFNKFILILVENCLYYNAINYFSVCLRTGSNPEDFNQFQTLQNLYIIYWLTWLLCCLGICTVACIGSCIGCTVWTNLQGGGTSVALTVKKIQ